MTNDREKLKKAYIQFMSEYLSVVFRLWQKGVPGNLVYKPEDLMVVALFRKWKVYLLSLCALYKDGHYEGSISVLRSSFECFLQLAYYLQDGSTKFEKCQCYCICQDYKRAHRFDWISKYDESSISDINRGLIINYCDSMKKLENQYIGEYYEQKKDELAKCKCPGLVEWFKLYDKDIRNFAMLAEIVTDGNGKSLRLFYDAIYDIFSCSAHSKDAWDGVVLDKEFGRVTIRSYDDPMFILSFDLEVLMVMLRILSEKLTEIYSKYGMDFSITREDWNKLYGYKNVVERTMKQIYGDE